MKKTFASAAKFAAGCIVTAALGMSAAQATIVQPFELDHLLGSANLPNSGADTELAAIEAASGNSSLVKLTPASLNPALSNPGTTDQFYIDTGSLQPLYFLLKFGTGNTSSQEDTFFFQNINELNKLVFSNSQMNFLSGGNCSDKNDSSCNIGRLSHYSIYGSTTNTGTTPPAGGTVPEPATTALLGLGLLGFAVSRRKAAKK